MNWDNYFGDLLEVIKNKSKDPSTKVGAIITDKNNAIISTGFNGFPIDVMDEPNRYKNRDVKYKFTIHAEHNAILLAARRGISLEGSVLWVSRYPCCECSKAIIQSGIKSVVVIDKEKNREFDDRWADSMNFAKQMFGEAKIHIRWSQ